MLKLNLVVEKEQIHHEKEPGKNDEDDGSAGSDCYPYVFSCIAAYCLPVMKAKPVFSVHKTVNQKTICPLLNPKAYEKNMV